MKKYRSRSRDPPSREENAILSKKRASVAEITRPNSYSYKNDAKSSSLTHSRSRTVPVSKTPRNKVVLYIRALLQLVWLAFGIYGCTMMAIRLARITSSGGEEALNAQHLRNVLQDSNTFDAQNLLAMAPKEAEMIKVNGVMQLPLKQKSESASEHLRRRQAGPEDEQPSKRKHDIHSMPDIPNVLLVGAQKSGTTALAGFIFRHSEVCKPVSVETGEEVKEVHFFDLEEEMHSKGVNFYKKHWSHCNDTSHVVDATPDYLRHAGRIHKMYEELGIAPNVKIIMILREPVDREYSWYHHMAEELSQNSTRPYTLKLLDDLNRLQRFEKYVTNTVLPNLDSSYGLYSKWLAQWMKYFDRQQILVLSYEELVSDQSSLARRVQEFLGLGADDDESPQQIIKLNARAEGRSQDTPSCVAHAYLAKKFEKYNDELYKMLEEHPGPPQEQRPFQKFEFAHCRAQTAKKLLLEEEELGGVERMLEESRSFKLRKKKKLELLREQEERSTSRPPPRTVYFATHHKTGTSLSLEAAELLKDQGLVQYSPDLLNEKDLFKNENGDKLTCTGSASKPEIRSYVQWPIWMIDILWNKCIDVWWAKWPTESSSDELSNCLKAEAENIKNKLKWASCDQEYLVVHWVRDPVDLMMSSFRNTRLGKDGWMHKQVGEHPMFQQEFCAGLANCQNMSITEAANKLPIEIGLKLEMNLVSKEVIKQIMVGSALAELDPEHHVVVSLSDMTKSSESFYRTWTRVLRGLFPTKSTEDIRNLLQTLRKLDPENFEGETHSSKASATKNELEKHKNIIVNDESIKQMLKDPLIEAIT